MNSLIDKNKMIGLIIVLFVGSVVSFDYCSLNKQNTMCKFKPTTYGASCMKTIPMSITAADKALIVDAHNRLRRQVAKGLEKRGSPGPQPTATNMRELTWDDEVALMAQTHAQQCVFVHDSNRDVSRFQVGQNLAIQFSTREMRTANWTGMIQNWYNEVTAMRLSYVNSFPAGPIGTIGHYTQMVWANTFKIGCGIVSYLDSKYQPSFPYKLFYVCNYGSAGNFLNQPIYRTGGPASACPPNTVAKDGLCA